MITIHYMYYIIRTKFIYNNIMSLTKSSDAPDHRLLEYLTSIQDVIFTKYYFLYSVAKKKYFRYLFLHVGNQKTVPD